MINSILTTHQWKAQKESKITIQRDVKEVACVIDSVGTCTL